MANISDFKIFIDPGHGGKFPGAEGNGLVEKDLTLDIAKHVRDRLKSYGASTMMSRETDKHLAENLSDDLKARVNLSKEFRSDIFVSVHINSVENTSANGLETWKDDNSSKYASDLAKEVQAYMVSKLKLFNRGFKSCDGCIYVINPTHNNPAWPVLAEVGFISNASDAEKLADATFRKNAGYAIADGIKNFVDNCPFN